MATIIIPLITADEGNTVDLVETAKNSDSENTFGSLISAKTYHKRLRDVVDDMIRLGYI